MRGETGLGRRNESLANLPVPDLLLTKLALANLLVTNLPLAKLPTDVGQVGNLRPIVNRPTAGPAKLFWRSRQPRCHWIHLNVITNSLKFRLVTNQPVIALILPERPPGQSKHLIALASRESLERLHHSANFHQGRHQEMNVIRHYDVGVELILPQVTKVDGIDYHSGNLGDAKEKRAGARVVEDSIHSNECSARGGFNREAAVRWKTAVQAPRDKDRSADGMVVRKTAASKGSHLETVAGWGKILRKVKRPIANRPQVTNLPHKAASSQQQSRQHRSQQAQQPAGTAASTGAGRHSSQQLGSLQANAA
jgi:hypothetical protein